MGYNITKTHLKHTSFDGPMSVDRQQRNISTPQHEISFHRVQRLQCVNVLGSSCAFSKGDSGEFATTRTTSLRQLGPLLEHNSDYFLRTTRTNIEGKIRPHRTTQTTCRSAITTF
jgi:hypothetical protein